jgi:circadian clock protein KaiC
LPKVPSGLCGLDEILHGGFPEGRTPLVSGGPGTGKTVLGLEFLYRSAKAGQAGIFLSFEEMPGEAKSSLTGGRTAII